MVRSYPLIELQIINMAVIEAVKNLVSMNFRLS